MQKGAEISDCGRYRFRLWRIWDETKPLVLFIMLNPSTADADNDDPTIRKLIGFCKKWDAGGFYVGNLSAFRTPSPAELKKHLNSEPSSGRIKEASKNQPSVSDMATKCNYAVVSWGAHYFDQSNVTEDKYRRILGYLPIFCLGVTKGGYPRHPLYVPYSQELVPWIKTENQ